LQIIEEKYKIWKNILKELNTSDTRRRTCSYKSE